MIINFKIEDSELLSNELYETELSPEESTRLLDDAVILLNYAYELDMDELEEYGLSEKTKSKLTEDKINILSSMRDNGWSIDTAIAMINYINGEHFVSCKDVLNYAYKE